MILAAGEDEIHRIHCQLPGGRGNDIVREAIGNGASLLALCDADATRIANTRKALAQKWPEAEKAHGYEDYRELIDKEIDGTLTADEAAELARLQNEMLAFRRRKAPRLIDPRDYNDEWVNDTQR